MKVNRNIWLWPFILAFGFLNPSIAGPKILCPIGPDRRLSFRSSEGLEDIRACNIIYGSVYILMLDGPDFRPLGNLTEIIGPLNLFSNVQLYSLNNLFPNLTVIRALDNAVPHTALLHLSSNPQ